jgi:molybdopterin-guanine dinucleotide biosynthesis protein A
VNLSAVILAGGESRRMGRDKAWVKFDGRSLLTQAVDKVREADIEGIFISSRPGGDYSALDRPLLFDLEPGLGPMGGIERGLHCCTAPLLLVLAVDLPHMTGEFLQSLAVRCVRSQASCPNCSRLEPLAAIYPKRCHAFALAMLAHGPAGRARLRRGLPSRTGGEKMDRPRGGHRLSGQLEQSG